jgi:hypothetical protein
VSINFHSDGAKAAGRERERERERERMVLIRLCVKCWNTSAEQVITKPIHSLA